MKKFIFKVAEKFGYTETADKENLLVIPHVATTISFFFVITLL